jgi:uncharacterized protein GlcG (DUF336 family)
VGRPELEMALEEPPIVPDGSWLVTLLGALVERSKTVPVLANLFKLPHLLLLGGGIVIKVGDEVVGAIGASGAPGGDLDDACARAGLDKIKDQLK